MSRRRPEQTIQRAIFEHLRWRGAANIFAFHPPNGGWRSPIEGAIFKSLGVVSGVPDVVIIKDGRIYALELKAASGHLTETQRETIERMKSAGAEVAVAYGIDEAVAQLAEWGLLRERHVTRKSDAIGRSLVR